SCIALAFICAENRKDEQFDSAIAEVRRLVADTAYDNLAYMADIAEAYRALRRGDREACGVWLAKGLVGSRGDEVKFMLRMQPRVLPALLAEAMSANVEKDLAIQLVHELDVVPPAPAPASWPWPLRIHTLGRFEILREGAPLEFSRKAPR